MRIPTISGLATATVLLILSGAAMAQPQGGQAMQGMDHSKMQGMDHSNMPGMDHSQMNTQGQGTARDAARDRQARPPARQGTQQRRSN